MVIRIQLGGPHGTIGVSVRGSDSTTYLVPDGTWVEVRQYHIRAVRRGDNPPAIEVRDHPPPPPVVVLGTTPQLHCPELSVPSRHLAPRTARRPQP